MTITKNYKFQENTIVNKAYDVKNISQGMFWLVAIDKATPC